MAKRHREEAEATAVQKAAKKLRQEMKKRGHVGVPKKGDDLQVDTREKALYKIATRYSLAFRNLPAPSLPPVTTLDLLCCPGHSSHVICPSQ